MSNWRHKVWDPTALELDLPLWATPYVLRHTAASLMAQQGVPCPRPPLRWDTIRRSSFALTRICTPAIYVPSPTRWTSHDSRHASSPTTLLTSHLSRGIRGDE